MPKPRTKPQPEPSLREDGKPYLGRSHYRWRRFAQEYVKDYNARRAALAVGYSTAAAHTIGYNLVRRPDVQELIRQYEAESRALAMAEFKVDKTAVLRELCRLGLYDMRGLFTADGHLLPMAQWPEDIARAVSSFEVTTIGEGAGTITKVKMADKGANLERLARHLGLFEKDNAQRGAAALTEILALIDGKTTNLIDVTPARLPAE